MLIIKMCRMIVKINIIIAILLFIYLTHEVFAADKPCGQHDLKVKHLRNCAGKGSQNLQMQNLTFILTDDCKFKPRGCFLVKKKISNAKFNYVVSKPPVFNKKGTEDFCEFLSDPKLQSVAAKYKSIDAKCPIEAGQYCITTGNTLVEQLNPSLLNMAIGTAKATINLESENIKDKTCIEMEIIISKRKGMKS